MGKAKPGPITREVLEGTYGDIDISVVRKHMTDFRERFGLPQKPVSDEEARAFEQARRDKIHTLLENSPILRKL